MSGRLPQALAIADCSAFRCLLSASLGDRPNQCHGKVEMSDLELGWSGWMAFAAIVLCGLFLFRYVGVNLSLSSVLVGLLLLFHGPAYLYYSRVWGPNTEFYYHILAAAPGQPIIRTLDLAIVCLFVFVPLGIKLADLWWRESGNTVRYAIANWKSSKNALSTIEASRLRMLLLAVGFGVMVPSFFLDHQWSKVSQYLSFDLSAEDKVELRREAGANAFYVYSLLIATLAPYLAFCAIAARKLSGRGWVLPVVGFVGLVAFAKMALLSKAPLAIFVLQIVIVLTMCKSLQLTLRTLYIVLGAALALFGVAAAIAMPTLDSVGVVGQYLFYRTFMVTNEGLLEYFSAIPYVLHFSWGAKMGWIASLFGGGTDLSNIWLVSQVHRGMLGSTTAVLFIGDAWADFSWIGVVLAPILLGFLVRALDIALICRRGKSIAAIGALGLGQFGVSIALHTALQTTLLTGGLLFVLPFCFALAGRQRSSLHAFQNADITRADIRG